MAGIEELILMFEQGNSPQEAEDKPTNAITPIIDTKQLEAELKAEKERYQRLNRKHNKEHDLLKFKAKQVEHLQKNIGKEAVAKSQLLKSLKEDDPDYKKINKECIEMIYLLNNDKAFYLTAKDNL